MKEVCLVVPTIREKSFAFFLERWGAIGLFDQVDLIIVEDNPSKTFKVPRFLETKAPADGRGNEVAHFSWAEIDESLGDRSWIVPRRSDTVRSFGYFLAWRRGHKYIMTLDDDCYPPDQSEDGLSYDGRAFVANHLSQLMGRTRWYNTLNDAVPRGVPYANRGKNDRVLINHGLWTGVLDYDAPHQLVSPAKETFSFDNRIVPNGSYFPMCGMNVVWRREATPLMYHLLMGQLADPDSSHVEVDGVRQPRLRKLPFDRFGDIWCGIFMKRILDSVGCNVSTGMPYIRHSRASDPFVNLRKEANGIQVNERLWEYVDAFRPVPDSFHMMYAQLGEHIGAYVEFPEHEAYFKQLGSAMVTWARLFKEV